MDSWIGRESPSVTSLGISANVTEDTSKSRAKVFCIGEWGCARLRNLGVRVGKDILVKKVRERSTIVC